MTRTFEDRTIVANVESKVLPPNAVQHSNSLYTHGRPDALYQISAVFRIKSISRPSTEAPSEQRRTHTFNHRDPGYIPTGASGKELEVRLE